MRIVPDTSAGHCCYPHSLESGDPVDGLERPQHAQQLQRLELLAGRSAAEICFKSLLYSYAHLYSCKITSVYPKVKVIPAVFIHSTIIISTLYEYFGYIILNLCFRPERSSRCLNSLIQIKNKHGEARCSGCECKQA
jgi:hypothetical protein